MIISGIVAEVGKEQAYFILKDDSAKVVVITTNVEVSDIKEASEVKILGTVEFTEGIYPTVKAKAVKQSKI